MDLDEDCLLLEFPLDRLTDADLQFIRDFCESIEFKPHSGPLRAALEQLAYTEYVRREGSPDTPPQRYYRFNANHWSGAELACALRVLDAMARSEGLSETLGKVLDELLSRVISWVNVRLTKPELYA
jgi:hypothetical protein